MDSVNPDPAHIPDDDLRLQNYQDDLDTSNDIADPIMDEDDDITKELGVDPVAFKEELDQYDFGKDSDGDGDDTGSDDRREQLEDLDQET